jgi:hypothetical protein
VSTADPRMPPLAVSGSGASIIFALEAKAGADLSYSGRCSGRIWWKSMRANTTVASEPSIVQNIRRRPSWC